MPELEAAARAGGPRELAGPRKAVAVPSRRAGPLRGFLRRQPFGALGGVITALMMLVSIGAPLIAPFDPVEPHYSDLFRAPSWPYLLGTDNFGRDVLSRLIWGAQSSVTVAFVGVLVGATVGAFWGVLSGYLGGPFDVLSQRLIDALQAFPVLILTLTVVAAFGPSNPSLIAAIALALVPQGARPARAVAISVRERQFVEAARCIGSGQLHIAMRHVFPNCLTPYIVVVSVSLGWAIVVEAALSFLGLGPPPPTPSWGAMLSGEGRQYLQQAPWLAIVPGLVISLTVFAVSTFGEAVSDELDPRLRREPSRSAGPFV